MNPKAIDDMSMAMADVYAAVTDRILINLAHHFPYVQTGQHMGSWEYQTMMLAQMGKVEKETIAIIAQSLGGADEALKQALETAILQGLKNEEPKLRQAAMNGLLKPNGYVPELDPSQLQAFTSYYRQSADKLNLVNTVMLDSTRQAYQATVADVAQKIANTQGILNTAAGEVVTGVSTWNGAMQSAVQKMVSNGITGFIDHAGHKWSPEAYVAMDIKTTMFNTARAAVWERSEQYGSDLYQVSSHNGARPLCYPWQGKVLSRSGWTGIVKDIDGNEVQVHSQEEVPSFGYGGSLFGANCGHYPMTFIPNFSTLKGEPQDQATNDKQYAETQQQRALERKLREEKRDLEVMKAQGAPAEQIKAQRERVRNASADIDEFCDETGLPRRRNREYTPINATFPNDVPPIAPTTPKTPPAPPPIPIQPNLPPITPPQNVQNVVAQKQLHPTTQLVTKALPNSGVKPLDLQKWDTPPTFEEIVQEIAGADKTKGSCASVSLAYAGNKAGYKVHDFRGGMSCDIFSTKTNTLQFAKLPEVAGVVKVGKQEIKIANQLLATMEDEKEYWLGIGRHASIVRRHMTQYGMRYQYLELQSAYVNGWEELNDYILKRRFGCVGTRSYAMPARLMDIEKLAQSDDFIEALKYINTEVGAQQKGAGGGIK